jgi:hypothetical protein
MSHPGRLIFKASWSRVLLLPQVLECIHEALEFLLYTVRNNHLTVDICNNANNTIQDKLHKHSRDAPVPLASSATSGRVGFCSHTTTLSLLVPYLPLESLLFETGADSSPPQMCEILFSCFVNISSSLSHSASYGS